MRVDALGNFVHDGGFPMIQATGGKQNVVGVFSYPLADLPQYKAPWLYGSTSPVGVAGYDSQPIGTRFTVLPVTSSAVTTVYEFIKTGATEWSAVGSCGIIADPGDGEAISVVGYGVCSVVTAGAETRTLAIPAFIGQTITICLKTDGGDAVVTTASAVNQTGNNTLTMADAGDEITLKAIENGAALAWRIVSNDGVALTTV